MTRLAATVFIAAFASAAVAAEAAEGQATESATAAAGSSGVAALAATNLVANGGFEAPDPERDGKPLAWETPDGLGVRWDEAPGGGRAIRLDTSQSEAAMVESWRAAGLSDTWDIPEPAGTPVAETYGLSYYSDPFPVASGMAYRVSCRVRGGVGAKVWVRCYGMFRGKMRRRYEAVMNCATGEGEWTENELVFHPTRHRPDVTEARVMLYAYYPPGVEWFDDVRVEPVPESEAE